MPSCIQTAEQDASDRAGDKGQDNGNEVIIIDDDSDADIDEILLNMDVPEMEVEQPPKHYRNLPPELPRGQDQKRKIDCGQERAKKLPKIEPKLKPAMRLDGKRAPSRQSKAGQESVKILTKMEPKLISTVPRREGKQAPNRPSKDESNKKRQSSDTASMPLKEISLQLENLIGKKIKTRAKVSDFGKLKADVSLGWHMPVTILDDHCSLECTLGDFVSHAPILLPVISSFERLLCRF